MIKQRYSPTTDAEVSDRFSSAGSGAPATSNLLAEDLLRAQYELFLALSQVRDLPETLRLCLESAVQVSSMDCGGIYLREDSGGLRIAQVCGLSDDFVEAVRYYPEDDSITAAVMAGVPAYLQCPELEPLTEAGRREGLQAVAVIPIRHDQRIIGCLIVGSRAMDEVLLRSRLALEAITATVGLFIRQAQADEALRSSEARFYATFEQAAVGLAHVAPDGRWLRVNRKLCGIVGYSADELLSLTFQDITYPEDLLINLDSVRRLLTREIDTASNEKRYVRKDGGIVWVNVTVTLTWKANGEPDYFIAVIEDIHARKRATDALRRFSRVIEQTASTVVITDTEGLIEYVNPRFSETTGYPVEEVIGRRPNLLKSAYTSPEEYCRLWHTIKGGEVWKGEFRNRRKDGSLYWESAIISPVRDERGEITHFVGIKDEITERKLAEAALKESEADLKKAQRMAHIGNGKWDLRTDMTIWSDELYGIFGRDPVLPATSHQELSRYFSAESWRRLSAAVDKTLQDGKPYDLDVEVIRVDGSRRWVHAHGEAGRDAGGTIVELQAMLQDITERKVLERQIIEVSAAEQERIGREIHDGIGQLLTAVGMLANSLERKLTQAKRLQEAKTAGDLARYLRQALGEAKSLAKGLSPIQVGPDGLADGLAALVDGARAWSGIRCRLAVSGAIVLLDEDVAVHLYRIAQEAINNAIKHAQAANIRVELRNADHIIVLSVHDDGIGLAPPAEKAGGLGVHIMRYRAGIIGASLSVAAAAGGGTLVECVWHKGC